MGATEKSKKKPRKAGKPPQRGKNLEREDAPKAPAGRERLLMAAVFLLALAVRTIYFFMNKGANPLFFHPNLDALFHHEWASRIVDGDFWGDEVFFKAPLYPYFLALLYLVSAKSIAFAVYFQHLIGAANCVLIYLLARRFFSVEVALLGGVIAALYWPLIYFEGDLLAVTLFVNLVLVFLLVFTVSLERGSVRMLALSGLILGFSSLARPTILVLVPILPVVIHFTWKGSGEPGGKRSWSRPALVLYSALVLAVLPVMVRNYVVGRDVVPIASQGGVNFYIGNNPESNGSRAFVPGAQPNLQGTYQGALELAENEVGHPLKPSEFSNYYFKKGLDFIVNSPAQAARLFLKKFYLFWAGVERSNNKYIQFFWREYGLGMIPLPGFWFVAPLGLLGGVLVYRRRRELSLLYLYVAAYMLVVVLFFVNGRFRLPVAPVLIIFASYAIVHLATTFKRKSPEFGKALLVLLLFEFGVNYDYVAFRGVRALDEAITRYELGNAFLRTGNDAGALEQFEKARRIQERYPTRGYLAFSNDIDVQLGRLYMEKGLVSQAIEALRRVEGSAGRNIEARNLLGQCYLRKGMLDEAIRTFQEVQRIEPTDPESRIGIAVAYRRKGDPQLLDIAEKVLKQIVQSPHASNDRAYLELARTLETKGDYEGAEQAYLSAVGSFETRLDALLGLAWLYKRKGPAGKVEAIAAQIRREFPVQGRLARELRALTGRR